MDWKQRHHEAFKSARHACGYDSPVRFVTQIIIAIFGIAALWLYAAPNDAWSEILVKSGATVAVLCILPFVYLWNLFCLGSVVRRNLGVLLIVIGSVLTILGIGMVALGILQARPATADNKQLQQMQNQLTAIHGQLSALAEKSDQTQAAAPPPAPTILVAGQFYSAKHKEEISGRLDRISDAINNADKDILLPAGQSITSYLFTRPNEAPSYLQRINQAIAAAAKFDATIYDDLLNNERDYRQEMNAILFPNDALIEFRRAADAYQKGVEAWVLLRNEDDARRNAVHQLVIGTQRQFNSAKDTFVAWLSERQNLIGQARRALRQ